MPEPRSSRRSAAQHDAETGNLLADVVVQVAGDPRPLGLLLVNQAAGEVTVLLGNQALAALAVAQRLFGAASTGALGHHGGNQPALEQQQRHGRDDVGAVPGPTRLAPETG